MRNMARYAIASVLPLVIAGSGANAAQLLVNPSFELPVVGSSTCSGVANCEGFNIGDNIGGWTVVGHGAAAGLFPVVMFTSAFVDGNGGHYTPENGNQSLDISGSGNQGANGVEQSVATTPGASYSLSFFVGNQDNSEPNFPLNSSVELLVDGTNEGNYTSTGNNHLDLSWAGFTFNFVAATALTTVEFLNATPTGDNEAGLDNVTLNQTAAPVDLSEPSTLAPLAVLAGLLLYLRRRKPVRVKAEIYSAP